MLRVIGYSGPHKVTGIGFNGKHYALAFEGGGCHAGKPDDTVAMQKPEKTGKG